MSDLAYVLSIVNAPYARQLTGPELAHALTDLGLASSTQGKCRHFSERSHSIASLPSRRRTAFLPER